MPTKPSRPPHLRLTPRKVVAALGIAIFAALVAALFLSVETTQFHWMVLGFGTLMGVSLLWQRHPLQVFAMGCFGWLFGFLIELQGIVYTDHWYWTGCGPDVAGVPIVVMLAYGFAAMMVAELAMNENMKKGIRWMGPMYYVVLALCGMAYGFLTQDFLFVALVAAVYLYSRFTDRVYILQLALFFAGADIAVENYLIVQGLITYEPHYGPDIYMGIFLGAIMVCALMLMWTGKDGGGVKGGNSSTRGKKAGST
jgi:hypothetical protein